MNLKKRLLFTATGLALGYWLKNRRKNSDTEFGKWDTQDIDQTIKNAGIPDQIDDYDQAQIENAKMVSEGSQYGVQYYTEQRADNVLNDFHQSE